MKREYCRSQMGSALVWAISIAALLSILTGTLFTLTQAYYQRTLNEVARQQSYYTALSGAELIANRIVEETQREIIAGNVFSSINELVNASPLIPIYPSGRPAEGMNVEFPEDKNMGECKVWVYWKDTSILRVESLGEFKETSDMVIIELQYLLQEDGASGDGSENDRNIFYTASSLDASDELSIYNTDIYSPPAEWGDNSEEERGNAFYSPEELNIDSILQNPPESEVVEIVLTNSNYQNILTNLQAGTIYHFTTSTLGTAIKNNAKLNIQLMDGGEGAATVYFTENSGRNNITYVIESIQEGITFFYMDENLTNTLKIGDNNNSRVDLNGGLYTGGEVTIHGNVNVTGYFILTKVSGSGNLSIQGSVIPTIGSGEIVTETLFWKIIRYTN